MNKSIIVAVDEKWGIGKDGVLPWHIPEDLKRFKELTKNSICIMGYNTYKEIAQRFNYEETRKFLPFRLSIVITKRFIPHSGNCNDDIIKNGLVLSSRSITEALDLVSNRKEDIFFLGGVGIFKESIDLVDKIYFTFVKGEFNCDVKFPLNARLCNNRKTPLQPRNYNEYKKDEIGNEFCFKTVQILEWVWKYLMLLSF